MSYRKTRVFLEPNCPVRLQVAGKPINDPKHSLELLEFEVNQDRCKWVIKLGDGSIVEGRPNQQIKLPFYPHAWIAISLPLTIHSRPRGCFAPNFILHLPDVVNYDYTKH